MKPTDLMIGDWVIIKDYPMKAMPKQMSPEYYTRSLVEIEPIPLTPEILEKNGFPYDNKERLYYPFSNKAFAIERDEHDDRVFYYSMYVYNPYSSFNWHEIIEIRYVHELQHALKLCGIEKEIVLQ